MKIGLDVGSTTLKCMVYDGQDQPIYQEYERHFSQIAEKASGMLTRIQEKFPQTKRASLCVSGSAGMGLAEDLHIPFVQEVYATRTAVKKYIPDADVVIELGGEDAKILFLAGSMEVRMNGSCAGGTGAFIDQMATLLNVTADELDELSLGSQRLYPIASRCGVFAKTDIQPLLNQGARHEDVAASIYQAVVNQTIAGLAQGRKITGKVLFLGGPLYYCKGLRRRFQETLQLSDDQAVFPEYGRFAVAMGAALYGARAGETFTMERLARQIRESVATRSESNLLPPLFETEADYQAFRQRHSAADVARRELGTYQGDAWLGIDCGSTTTKVALLGAGKELLYTYYASNRGNPVQIVKEQLEEIYRLCGDRVTIRGSAVTGYGEELIRAAFNVDKGVVETIAHYTAAKYFCPQVDFILDIGGQDIKCFKIKNGAIDSIMLNEACSSGCGSFIETFARSMGCDVAAFAEKGLHSRAPVNLGSRCTVFMNSSVKQSQKDGATVEDISAGLSVSVVKNAIYKVIRAGSADELGEHVVVQGGTFYNDAVLRAFELELGKNVIRPAIAGLMGAYGAALYAMDLKESTIITAEGLKTFVHTAKAATCQGCTNHCRLTINSFVGGKKYISGNQCQKGLGIQVDQEVPNLYAWKRDALTALAPGEGKRGAIGLPLALGMYELLPLWHAFFRQLGFRVEVSGLSSRRVYEKGQFSIPSDTACYPAKIMHGHMELLLERGVDAIFYPCLTYNVDEKESDNHYNCPVVAYYSELLHGNMDDLQKTNFLYPFLNINDRKELTKELFACLSAVFPDITKKEVRQAVDGAFGAYEQHMLEVRRQGEEAVAWARAHGRPIMILAGRPYHIDPEIGHGIDKLAASLGFVVVSEDSVCHLADPVPVHVLNQWTYHARLYRAARYACEHADTQLVQLVSFGCGVDAITTDEVRRILEESDKLYTQIKIDEITNLGAVKIRLRSLIGALEEKGGAAV